MENFPEKNTLSFGRCPNWGGKAPCPNWFWHFLGPREPLVLPLFGPSACKNSFSSFFSSICLVNPVTLWWAPPSPRLLMIIWKDQLLANDHPVDPASCKWSFGGSSLLQMIIQRIRPLANDHPEDLASCKWSYGGTGLLQMIICHPRHPNHLSQDPDSISRTFLEQFALVLFLTEIKDQCCYCWKSANHHKNIIDFCIRPYAYTMKIHIKVWTWQDVACLWRKAKEGERECS